MSESGIGMIKHDNKSDIALKWFLLYVTPLCVYLQSLFFATTNIWAAGYIAIICLLFVTNGGIKFKLLGVDTLFGIFLIIVAFSSLGSGDYLYFLQTGLIILFVFGFTKYRLSTLYRYLDIFVVFGMFCAVGCILQELWPSFYTVLVSRLFKPEEIAVIEKLEVNMGNCGIMPQTSYAAEYILNAFLILSFKGYPKRKKLIWGIVLFIGILLTGKRAHLFMGALVYFLSFFVGFGGKKKTTKLLYGTIAASGIVVVLLFITPLLPADNTIVKGINTIRNFDFDDEDTMHGRQLLYADAIIMGNSAPLTGHGWGSFKKTVDYRGGSTDVHNIYLQLYAELGIIVLSLFVLSAILLMVKNIQLLKAVRKKFPEESMEVTIVKLAFCFLSFFFLYGLTGNPLYNISFFIVLGLGVSMIKRVDAIITQK